MSYILIIITLVSGFVLFLKDIRPNIKTTAAVLAFLCLVVISIIQIVIETKRVPNLIAHYHEEIDDFRDWKSDEAKYRILANVKRLSRLGEEKFDLNRCTLDGIDLKGLKIKDSDLNCINLSNAYISDCVFENVNFTGAILARATIVNSSFINCKVDSANYFDVILLNVDFKSSDLTHFDHTNNLHKARVIHNCRNINEQLLTRIKNQSPELLEKPTALKMTRFPVNWKINERH